MIRPIINEIFPSFNVFYKNRYINHSNIINNLYECGIKSIETPNDRVYIHTNNEENKRLYGTSINDAICKINTTSKRPIRLVVQGDISCDFPYIYNSINPDVVEVPTINNFVLKTVHEQTKLFIKPSSFEEVDKAYYECIYNYSSSLLQVPNTVETIKLIKHLQSKLGVELPISISNLEIIKKELEDSYKW